jgi:hypothetical protein
MLKCIYCLKEAEKSSFLKSEHVLPQSFGKFKNNFTLIGKVCDECNSYFGENIELPLARATLEGISRVDYGVQAHQDYRNLGKNSRLTIKMAEGPFKGAYAYREYSKKDGAVMPKPIPQVGFLVRHTGDYTFFPLESIPNLAALDQQAFDINRPDGIMMIPEFEEITKKALSERGYNIIPGHGESRTPEGKGDLLFEIEWFIDTNIQRAIAKIGLNYWTYWDKADLIFDSSFDVAREYIRYGRSPPYPVVDLSDPNRPLLADEPVEGLRNVGHMITAGWNIDFTCLLAQVTLFNRVTYPISLAAPYAGPREGIISRGHFFNTNTHEIVDLEAR